MYGKAYSLRAGNLAELLSLSAARLITRKWRWPPIRRAGETYNSYKSSCLMCGRHAEMLLYEMKVIGRGAASRILKLYFVIAK